MLRFEVIGYLGADAKVIVQGGRSFVTFNVAHNGKWSDENGAEHSRLQWVSCALDGDGGRLLPFLKRGRSVYVCGRGSARVFSSEKERRMVAGLNLSVERLELIGGEPDAVPRQLATEDGEIIKMNKAYFVTKDELEIIGVKKGETKVLLSSRGEHFTVDSLGFVTPKQD